MEILTIENVAVNEFGAELFPFIYKIELIGRDEDSGVGTLVIKYDNNNIGLKEIYSFFCGFIDSRLHLERLIIRNVGMEEYVERHMNEDFMYDFAEDMINTADKIGKKIWGDDFESPNSRKLIVFCDTVIEKADKIRTSK